MKKKLIKAAVILVLVLACAYFLYTSYLNLTDQSQIEKTFYQIVTSEVPVRVRAVFLSDLHLKEFGENNSELIASIRELAPDLVLIGGDMNMVHQDYASVLSLCRELVTIAPVYYGLGNHELTQIVQDGRQIFDDIAATGAVMLNDTCQKVTVGSASFWIGGLSEQGGGIKAYSNDILGKLSEKEGFTLLLSHYPSNFDVAVDYDIDLMLSGHLHGGQIRFPKIGGLFSYEDGILPAYTEGMFYDNGVTMIVSRGLGNSHTLPRFNNPPELVIVDFGAQGALTASEQKEESGLTSDYKPIVYVSTTEDGGGKLDEIVKEKASTMEAYSSRLLDSQEKAQTEAASAGIEEDASSSEVIYAPEGTVTRVRLDNIITEKGSYRITAADSSFTDSLYLLPDVSGQRSFTVTDDNGNTMNYHFASARVGGRTDAKATVMLIGDDYMDSGTLPCEIARLINQQFQMNSVTFAGMRSAAGEGMTCAYEGFSGYGFEDLLKLDDSLGQGNAFPNPYNIGGTVSVAAYLAKNGLPAPDIFVVYLGLSDLIHYGTGESGAAEVVCERAKTFLNLLHEEFPNASLLLCGPVYVSDQNGQVNAAQFNGGIDEINTAYRNLCLQPAYASFCTYVNAAFTFDRNNAFATGTMIDENGQTVLVQEDWIHPSDEGFRLIAQPIAAALMSVILSR